MKVNFKTVSIPFKHPFVISKASKTHQPIFLVELDHFGIKGYGEAPSISYYNISTEKMIEDLEKKKMFIEKFAFSDPERFWHFLHHLFPDNSFLVAALDMAGWDIFGKIKRKQLHQLWNLNSALAPSTDFTIGIDSIEMMIKKMKETPWPIYKIKVGFENDIETITELRKHTDAIFRVDANEAWDVEMALKKIPLLKALNVELVEQPLEKNNWEGMKILFENSDLPLFADESCVQESDVEKCHHFFHGINIKLTKCSGITPARRMIEKAKQLDLKIMIGCMNETSIGTAAITQLAPMVDFVDMDGTLLQKEKYGEGVDFEFWKFLYNDIPGIGVNVAPF